MQRNVGKYISRPHPFLPSLLLQRSISSLRRANLQCQLRIEQVARGGLMATSTADSASADGGAQLRQRSAAESPSTNNKKKTVDKERLVNSVSDVTDGMFELSRKLNMQVFIKIDPRCSCRIRRTGQKSIFCRVGA